MTRHESDELNVVFLLELVLELDFLHFYDLLFFTQLFIPHYIVNVCVIFVEINLYLKDIATPHPCKNFDSGCTLHSLPITRVDIQALDSIRLNIFKVLNFQRLSYINLLFYLQTCIPDL